MLELAKKFIMRWGCRSWCEVLISGCLVSPGTATPAPREREPAIVPFHHMAAYTSNAFGCWDSLFTTGSDGAGIVCCCFFCMAWLISWWCIVKRGTWPLCAGCVMYHWILITVANCSPSNIQLTLSAAKGANSLTASSVCLKARLCFFVCGCIVGSPFDLL